MLRRALCGAVAVVLPAMLVLLPASPASAHAVFVSASPAPGVSLSGPPARLRIVFSEPLVPALSSVTVHRSSGATVPARSARVDPGDRRAYELTLPRLRPDRYTVVWHTTSQLDGHVRWGSYAFTVLEPGGAAPPVAAGAGSIAAPPAQVPTPVQAATSWAALAGLFTVVGAMLMLLLGGVTRPPARRLFGRLLVAAALATLIGVLDQFAAVWAGAGWRAGALPSVLGDGIAGWLWLRLGAVLVAVLAWPWRRTSAGAARPALLVAAALAAVFSFAASGHGAATARPAAGLAFIAVHVLAASVWLGGVLALAIVWMQARRDRTDPTERRRLLRRFSLVAGTAVPAVVASGAASALLELGSVTDFVRSGYAITLLVKLAAAAAVGVAAVRNALAHRRGTLADTARVRGWLWAEAGLGLLVLVPTATMSVLAPSGPSDAARTAGAQLQAASDPAAAFTGTATLGGRGVELSLTPGTAGTNAVHAELDGTVAAPRLQFRLGTSGQVLTATLHRTGYDHDPQTHTIYAGTITVATAGTWQAVLHGPAGTSAPITVPLRAAVDAPSSSPPRLDEWLLAIAVLGAAGVLFGATRYARGHRRWHRASFTLAGAGAAAALAGVTALSLAVPSGTAAAVATPWGVANRVAPATRDGVTTWPVGGSGAGLMMPALGPDGSVWVGEMDANALARLRPGSDVVQQFRLPGGYKEVMGVAVDDDDHVWIAEEHAQALGMFDPATGRYRQYHIPGGDPAPLGIAVDATGEVWFTMANGNELGRFDPATAHFTDYPIPTAHALPYWLDIGPRGRVWFTEFGAGKLAVLDPGSGSIREYPLPAGSSPAGIAITATGSVWASTTEGLLVNVAAGRMQTYRAPVADEYGVAVTSRGTVWLGLASGSAVYSFDPADAAFAAHPLPAGDSPWWVAAGAGHVWAASSSAGTGGLSRLDPVS